MSPNERLLLLGILAVLLIALTVWILLRLRMTPSERERRRRLLVDRIGRMSDGMLTDMDGDTLYFTYTVRGVDYAASQDVSALGDHVPEDRNAIIGPVTLKYSLRNPPDSIVVCERWSGLRTGHQVEEARAT